MAFEKQAVNYAAQYQQALSQMFPYVLYFGALHNTENNGRFRWVNEKTIEIPTISTSGRTNADRDSIGTKARRWNNQWTPKVLKNERSWQTLVHPRDIDQTNVAASIQNITQVFNNEQKFPEMDAYLISELYAAWVAAGKAPISVALDNTNVLVKFDEMYQAQTEARVPTAGRALYITPAVDTILKNAVGIARNFDVQAQSPVIQRAVSVLERTPVEVVPSELMKTVYNFTEGWEIGVSAKQIQMLLVHPDAVITPVSYEFAQLDPPAAGSGGKYDYYEESHEDVFILPKKESALGFVLAP